MGSTKQQSTIVKGEAIFPLAFFIVPLMIMKYSKFLLPDGELSSIGCINSKSLYIVVFQIIYCFNHTNYTHNNNIVIYSSLCLVSLLAMKNKQPVSLVLWLQFQSSVLAIRYVACFYWSFAPLILLITTLYDYLLFFNIPFLSLFLFWFLCIIFYIIYIV